MTDWTFNFDMGIKFIKSYYRLTDSQKNKTKKSILVILLPVSTISRRELLKIAILVIPDFISFINWSFTEQFVENTLMSAIGSTK